MEVVRGRGVVGVTDSSELLEETWLDHRVKSVSVRVMTESGFLIFNWRTRFWADWKSRGLGGDWHQLRMVDLRARLGMMVEKSGVEPSERVGLKERERQARTELRSKVWPEETITGSDMREPEIGQMNSFGGCFLLELEVDR